MTPSTPPAPHPDTRSATGARATRATRVARLRRPLPLPHRTPTRRLLAVVGAAAVLGAAALVVTGRGSSAASGYRTTTVATRAVGQQLDRVATVEPVTQASVAFPTAGTVASVEVAVSDRVTVGQPLARLDADALEAPRAEAQAALDTAELTLERALAGEDVSGGASAPGTGSTPTSPTGSPSASGSAVATAASWSSAGRADSGVASVVQRAGAEDAELTAAQQAVLDAQQRVDADLAAAQQALDDAAALCASVGETTGPAVADAGTSPDTGVTTTVPADDGSHDVAACRDALDAVLDAQQTVADDQRALADASDSLDALLDERAATVGDTGGGAGSDGDASGGPQASTGGQATPGTQPDSSAGTQSGASAPQQGTGGSAPSATGGEAAQDATRAGSSAPTAAQLVAYQKDVDAAAAQVAVAEQALAQATIVSPIAGAVQAVNLAVGDEVTAASATAAIVIVGSGGYEVTTTVTANDLPDLAMGQEASVTPDGSDTQIDGEIVGIGVAGTTSGSSTTYPVTIGLTADAGVLRNGSTASVTIIIEASTDALAVPTSAVTLQGGRSTVRVLDGGDVSAVVVETGAVGATWTEIRSGLDEGQTVVLADLDESLPGSATESTSAGEAGGPTGFPGGGRLPAGGPPAG